MRNSISKLITLKQSYLIVLRLAGVSILFFASLILTNYYSQELVGQFEIYRTFLILLGSVVVVGMDRSILQFAGRLKTKYAMNSFLGLYISSFKIIGFIWMLILVLFFLYTRVFDFFFLKLPA